jgi:hypothetical protein
MVPYYRAPLQTAVNLLLCDEGSDDAKKRDEETSYYMLVIKAIEEQHKKPSAILDEGPQYKSKPLCNHRRTNLLRRQDRLPRAHPFRRFQIFKPLHDLRSCRPTPTQLGFRGPRPGPRLRAFPGPSRALGPALADPSPFQHTLLTECPDSDTALPQATIQPRPLGTSCQLRLPSSSPR